MTSGPTAPASAATPALEARRLTRRFGELAAVDDVSFRIERGLSGFLGPNGAGKTTTFRMLAGSLGPSSGEVWVLGRDMSRAPRAAKRQIGYMPEAAPLYPEMTVAEYLHYRAALRVDGRAARQATVSRSVERTGLGDVQGVPIGHLSKGYRQRVALSDALLGEPPVLLLDEPTAGLDPNQVLEVRQLLRELGRERTVLLSTHVLSEVEAVCERALVIDRGRLVASGTLAELGRRARGERAELLLRDPQGKAEALLGALGWILEAAPSDGERSRWFVAAPESEPADAHALVERALATLGPAGVAVLSAAPERAQLDEVFRALTRGTAPPEA
ncbi:MAG TPA: ABC transporter ATP-binding protein [Polyangiaceae bacterium]|nr:ABC transporter ATP-binding protein [Polyangiaceae bacterium]